MDKQLLLATHARMLAEYTAQLRDPIFVNGLNRAKLYLRRHRVVPLRKNVWEVYSLSDLSRVRAMQKNGVGIEGEFVRGYEVTRSACACFADQRRPVGVTCVHQQTLLLHLAVAESAAVPSRNMPDAQPMYASPS